MTSNVFNMMAPAEFDKIVTKLKDKLYRFSLQILKEKEDAEDIVQETFLKLWAAGEGLKKVKNLEAYSMTMARNLSLDLIRSGQLKRDKLKEFRIEKEADNEEKKVEQRDATEKVRSIIEKLPETQRLVMHLRDVEEMEFEEIATVMEMNPNAIRVNLSRARKHVRDELEKKYHYEYR